MIFLPAFSTVAVHSIFSNAVHHTIVRSIRLRPEPVGRNKRLGPIQYLSNIVCIFGLPVCSGGLNRVLSVNDFWSE